METKLAEELKKLQVFTAYDFFKMDALVQDLTNALDESTRSKGKNKPGDGAKKTKRRSKKRRSHQNPMAMWELGNMSEASESSLDEAIKDYMENIAEQSDSDDLVAACRRLPSLTALTANPVFSLAESDSVNENFSPIRPCRRKRRFKRMAVDVHNPSLLDIVNACRGPDKACDSLLMSPPGPGPSQNVQLGKRKRSIRDKASTSFELDNVLDDGSVNGGEGSSQNMDSNGVSESGTSSLSSNESDGLNTNDDSRDGDDEQSDFYHELGPACGIPGTIPWWEANTVTHGPGAGNDPSFESILRGSFEHMSKTARRNFKARLRMMSKDTDRQYRSGRRRLHDMRTVYSLSCFLQERQQSNDQFKKPHAARQVSGSSSNGGARYDPKRRRKTPPTSEQPEVVGGKAEPVPESNVGNRMLQSMGWTPGTGLGADGTGIMNPVLAYKRPWRQGLGVACTGTPTSATMGT